jgi:uncharacterized protein YdhG (YjbR/CyaY superfamily)
VIDDYLENVEPAKRKELERIRALANAIVPDAEEVISYKMPTLKYRGKSFLGFDAHMNHIGIYPYSGKIIPELVVDLRTYLFSKGALQVLLDKPIPRALLKVIILRRLAEIDASRSYRGR